MNHGYFLHKCYMVGRPFWAMRAHSPFLLLIHSRSAPPSVPKLLGDLYAQSSPAFSEQGLSGQVTCAHWEPWAVQALPVNQRDSRLLSLSPCPWSSGRDSLSLLRVHGFWDGLPCLSCHSQCLQPASSEDADLWLQLCLAFCLAPLSWLSF